MGWLIALAAATPLILLAVMAASARAEAARAEAAAPPLGYFKAFGAGARLHYVAHGAATADAPPIVLVHGAGGTLRHFTATILDALSLEHRVIAVDRPGSGYSLAPQGFDGSIASQAAFLVEGLRAVGVERAVWVGHSYGGAVALRAALDHPQAVAALALLAPATTPFTPRPPFPSDTVDSARLRALLAWTVAIPKLKKAREALAALVFNPDAPPETYHAEAGGVLSLRPGQAIAAMRDQAALQPGLAEQAPRYAALAAPTHVLFGAEDAILAPEEHAAPLIEAAPRTRVETLPGRGHMLPFSAPEETMALIRAAVADAAATR